MTLSAESRKRRFHPAIETYGYDAAGNLTGKPYDNNGNTQTKVVGSNTTSYSWDFENRLSSVTLPGTGGTVSFKYDPFGRRIYKSSSTGTSVFVYDGDNLVEETNAAGAVVARYTQTNNIDEPVAMLRSGTTSYYQADGIGVQLLQFLPFLAPAVNIEVVKSGLPDSRQTRVSAHEWQPQLRVRNPPLAFPQVPRDALLQRFQRHRWRNLCRLADQKMHVVRHHHVPHQQKVIPLANLSEGMYKQVSRTNRPQQGQLPVTAKGDKVQITPAVIALQLLGHSQIQSPTCNSDTWGTRASAYSNAVVNYNGGILSLCSNEEGEMAFAQQPPGHPPKLMFRLLGVFIAGTISSFLTSLPHSLITSSLQSKAGTAFRSCRRRWR